MLAFDPVEARNHLPYAKLNVVRLFEMAFGFSYVFDCVETESLADYSYVERNSLTLSARLTRKMNDKEEVGVYIEYLKDFAG